MATEAWWAGENRKLATDFGISINKMSFQHPSRPEKQVHWFFDWVHTHKNCRNHVIKPEGIVMPDGTRVGKPEFEKCLMPWRAKWQGKEGDSIKKADFSFASKLGQFKQ